MLKLSLKPEFVKKIHEFIRIVENSNSLTVLQPVRERCIRKFNPFSLHDCFREGGFRNDVARAVHGNSKFEVERSKRDSKRACVCD